MPAESPGEALPQYARCQFTGNCQGGGICAKNTKKEGIELINWQTAEKYLNFLTKHENLR